MKYRKSDLLDRRIKRALEQTGAGVWEHNLTTDEIVWNEQMLRLYQQDVHDTSQLAFLWLNSLHPEDRARAIADFEQAAVTHGPYESRYRIILANGAVKHLHSRGLYDINEAGQPCYYGTEWDVTPYIDRLPDATGDLAELDIRNRHVEHVDAVTRLPNRMRLYDILRRNESDVPAMAVAQLDLVDFRGINDEYGYEVGDRLLSEVAAVLHGLMPHDAALFRSGSDEFTVIMSDSSQEMLEQFARAALAGVRSAAQRVDAGISGTAHIGAAHALPKNSGPRLLALAEAALIQAQRRNIPFVLFDDVLQAELLSQKVAKRDFKKALDLKEIEPFYQVQIDPFDGAIVGLEALARWRHPEKGLLSPAVFLPLAEANGLEGVLDQLIFDRVLQDRDTWRKQGLEVPRIAINVSAGRLNDELLIKSLAEENRDYSGLSFELVETIYFDGISGELLNRVDGIRALGIELEIDDFGSGHASLLSLLKIQPNKLKIDRDLVSDIVTSKQQRQVVAAIVEIAKILGVGVIAEGVETPEQASLLKEMGCRMLQGYLYGRPEPASEVAARLHPAAVVRGSE